MDGAPMLSAEGFTVLLDADGLKCDELLVFLAVMEWAKQRYAREVCQRPSACDEA